MTADPTIGPTPERLAMAGENVEAFSPDETINFRAIRMLDGSPIEKLFSLGRKAPAKGITGDQFNAAFRYFSDAYHGGIVAAGGAIDLSREKVDCGGYKDIPDHRLAAQTRFNNANRSLSDDSARILSDVVLSEVPLNIFADRYRMFSQLRERRAIALNGLRTALDELVRHYWPPRRDGIAAAHVDGYRPTIRTEQKAP